MRANSSWNGNHSSFAKIINVISCEYVKRFIVRVALYKPKIQTIHYFNAYTKNMRIYTHTHTYIRTHTIIYIGRDILENSVSENIHDLQVGFLHIWGYFSSACFLHRQTSACPRTPNVLQELTEVLPPLWRPLIYFTLRISSCFEFFRQCAPWPLSKSLILMHPSFRLFHSF